MESNNENTIKLSCKNLDAYKAFLSRLGKVSNQYVRMNDTWIHLDKKEMKAFNDVIPGTHMVKDPFIDLSSGACMCPNERFYIRPLEDIINDLVNVNENSADLRKSAEYNQWMNDAASARESITFNRGAFKIPVTMSLTMFKNRLQKAGTMTMQDIKDNVNTIITATESIGNFNGLLTEHTEYEWKDLSIEELIDIRNYKHINKRYNNDYIDIPIRLLKPMFTFAGTLRKNTPIAISARYRVVDINAGNACITGTVQIHAKYPCLTGSHLSIEAVHEYIVVGWSAD